jgi:bifunctional DNase/RNase
MAVQVELKRIIISEASEQQVIYLKEVHGERSFPIVIGSAEAFAIDRRLKGQPTPRPQTHELLSAVIEKLDARLERIVINDLQDHTFFARLVIRHHAGPGGTTGGGTASAAGGGGGGKTVEVDSRPSDAIALGVANNVPIFVAEHVLDEVGN